MGMVVQHNMNAINAYNRLNANVAGLKKASEKLASGYRINRAGDDAAGLAISEKMRSQIKGLNQAVRNSQDGINMIQTFEGAAQETHNILQRMKELATESANGTYDNPVDRAAIELEFQQLNDELNQIADTDFNGTIVLNGGIMSDGLNAVDNEFNYANKTSDMSKAAQKLLEQLDAGDLDGKYSDAVINKLKELKAKKDEITANNPSDIVKDDKIWGNLGENMYQADQAKALWEALKAQGFDTSAGSVKITFEVDIDDNGVISYKAIAGETDTGVSLTKEQYELFVATAVNGDADKTGAGGFTVAAGGGDIANATFDATKVKKGDVITIEWTGPGAAPKAPTNASFGDDSIKASDPDKHNVDETKYSITMNNLKDEDMDETVKKVLDFLNGASWELTLANTQKTPAALANILINGKSAAGTGIYTMDDGTKFFITLTADTSIKISTISTDGLSAGTDIFTINFGTSEAATGASTLSFKTFLDSYSAPGAGAIDAKAINTPTSVIDTSEADAAQAKLDGEILRAVGMSISDAFNKSTARMTYADHITLQTGARTKDAVDFTFNYNLDGNVDLGDLISNLNLSARADGLNTANLTLANQEDANYAIDQIDKAINKTSMVRATFGAIQNRLEHKITNLTTTAENLTEAESAIRDTDMAQEMMNYTKFNILQQAAQSMLAQANQQPQSILQLLG